MNDKLPKEVQQHFFSLLLLLKASLNRHAYTSVDIKDLVLWWFKWELPPESNYTFGYLVSWWWNYLWKTRVGGIVRWSISLGIVIKVSKNSPHSHRVVFLETVSDVKMLVECYSWEEDFKKIGKRRPG